MKKTKLFTSAVLMISLFTMGMAGYIIIEPFTTASANAGICCSTKQDNCGGGLICCDFNQVRAVTCSQSGLPDYCLSPAACPF